MNKSFNVKLLSPKGEVSYPEANELFVTTDFGPIGIYPNHTSIVNHIGNPSSLRIKENKQEHFYLVENGAVWVEKDKNLVSILADYLLPSEEIDLSEEQKKAKEIEEKLKSLSENDSKEKLALKKAYKRALTAVEVKNLSMGVKK